jgi:hypothetical protein
VLQLLRSSAAVAVPDYVIVLQLQRLAGAFLQQQQLFASPARQMNQPQACQMMSTAELLLAGRHLQQTLV